MKMIFGNIAFDVMNVFKKGLKLVIKMGFFIIYFFLIFAMIF